MAETTDKPVVDPVKMPKMKMSSSALAKLNAWAIAGATFFGFCAIFVAIAGFTKGKWIFSFPIFTALLGVNATSFISTALLVALFAVAFSIFAIVTINKVTDAETTKNTWACIAKTFLAFAIVYAIDMIGIIIYSLMSIGRKRYDQGPLWLSSFLPTVILFGASVGMHFIAKAIAHGKTSLLRVMSIVSVCIAGVALILVFIQSMVSFYGKSSTSKYEDMLEDYSGLLDLLK